jgi:hypothetical protein
MQSNLNDEKLGLETYHEFGNLLLQMATGKNNTVALEGGSWLDSDVYVLRSHPFNRASSNNIEQKYTLRLHHTSGINKLLFGIELNLITIKKLENGQTTTDYSTVRIDNVLALVMFLHEHGVPFDKKVRYWEM